MIVLRSGPALAVLLSGVGPEAAEHDRIAGAALRSVTGRHDLVLERRPSGRPRLRPPHRELAVSLSYRSGLLLAGYAPDNDTGVDVELASGVGGSDPSRMAADHFAAAEAIAVRNAAAAEARDLLLRLWVAKEAALKTTGRGIYDGMREPDLAGHLAQLRSEGAAVSLPASSHLPALTVAVWRPLVPGLDAAPYCGLAHAS